MATVRSTGSSRGARMRRRATGWTTNQLGNLRTEWFAQIGAADVPGVARRVPFARVQKHLRTAWGDDSLGNIRPGTLKLADVALAAAAADGDAIAWGTVLAGDRVSLARLAVGCVPQGTEHCALGAIAQIREVSMRGGADHMRLQTYKGDTPLVVWVLQRVQARAFAGPGGPCLVQAGPAKDARRALLALDRARARTAVE